MGSYSLIYHGPSAEDDPRVARRVAEAVAARWPLSEREAFRRLSRTPFPLRSGLTHEQALLYNQYLQGFGARTEIVPSPEDIPKLKVEPNATPVSPSRRWYLRHAWKAAFAATAAGLLFSSVIIVAGVGIVFLGRILGGPGAPPELFSAAGWLTVAFGLLILIGIFVLRLKELIRIVSPPDLSSPIQVLRSYALAINDRNWNKAIRCLAARPDSNDLGASSQKEIFVYFRSLARRLVMNGMIDPATVTILQEGDSEVVLRIQHAVLSREPSADGTYLRRSLVESKRFLHYDGSWFLVDGYLLGQPDPALLPNPACPECGTQSEIGNRRCTACDTVFPVPVHAVEEMQPPRRKPDLAALMSAVVPGLGQAYNGQPLKGLLIAATCWAILPWAAGVVDALRTAGRINRDASFHDLPSRPLIPVIFHLAVFTAALVLIFAYPQSLSWIIPMKWSGSTEPAEEEPVYQEPEGRFTVLFPDDWQVSVERDERDRPVVVAITEDGSSTMRIASRKLPEFWQPCRQMQLALSKLEEEGAKVESRRCGFIDERIGYRLDSYSSDMRWRRTLILMAVESELYDIAFVCPAERQMELKPLFERVIASLRFKEEPIRF